VASANYKFKTPSGTWTLTVIPTGDCGGIKQVVADERDLADAGGELARALLQLSDRS
jgi:hypothetical protein